MWWYYNVVTMFLMSSFVATATFCSALSEGLAKVERRLPAGFATTGRVGWRSTKHGLVDVEVQNNGGDVNDCWVVLTSFGISPSKDLGSVWGDVAGVGR